MELEGLGSEPNVCGFPGEAAGRPLLCHGYVTINNTQTCQAAGDRKFTCGQGDPGGH